MNKFSLIAKKISYYKLCAALTVLLMPLWAQATKAQNKKLIDPIIQTFKTKKHHITLKNMNPYINKWFLLTVTGPIRLKLHLENRNPDNNIILKPDGFIISPKDSDEEVNCPVFKHIDQNLSPLVKFNRKNRKQHPYAPICKELIYVRIKKESTTRLSFTEWATQTLRTTSFGENIINAIKPFIVERKGEISNKKIAKILDKVMDIKAPARPFIKQQNGQQNRHTSSNHNLGFTLDKKNPHDRKLFLGRWYKTKMHDGVYTTLYTADMIPNHIMLSHKNKVRTLQAQELNKLIYITAYDLDRFTINYAVGTKHPEIDTSRRSYGNDSVSRQQIVPIGGIPPYDLNDSVGVFIGGFKTRHGKFRAGPHRGKTYGYIQNGVELAPMSDGLATVYVTKNNKIEIGKWPKNIESQRLKRKNVVAARQNGTLIIDRYEPGEQVNSWRGGNWSASANGVGRSLRSGICLQEKDGKQFLLFMAFTSATPSSMARTMQAFHCRTGMHLDMNAHMYLHNAIYSVDSNKKVQVEYLNKEMLYPKNLKLHRFIMDNNGRDFFYVKKKQRSGIMSIGH